MNNALRVQYLNALGVKVWQSRSAGAETMRPSAAVSLYADLSWEALCRVPFVQSGCVIVDGCRAYQPETLSQTPVWLVVIDAEEAGQSAITGDIELLLTEVLAALALSRAQVFMTQVLRSLAPHPACADFLTRQVELLRPQAMLVFGAVAAASLLNRPGAIAALRGKLLAFASVPLVATYHPAEMLHSAECKRAVWQDLQLALNLIKL